MTVESGQAMKVSRVIYQRRCLLSKLHHTFFHHRSAFGLVGISCWGNHRPAVVSRISIYLYTLPTELGDIHACSGTGPLRPMNLEPRTLERRATRA